MSELASLKSKIYKALEIQVQQKISEAQRAVNAAIESRDGETKSSAGDKFETGRAMMQLEQQRHEVQLSKAFQLQTDLERLDMETHYSTVTPGALVKTNRGIYFMSIGMGKVTVDSETVYCISIQSPIGEKLLHQNVGESVEFQGKPLKIVEVV